MSKGTKQDYSEQIPASSELDDILKSPSRIITESKPPVLSITPMNQYIDKVHQQSIPNQLFGPLWYEGEICYLFSNTGLGKSILALQIADSITKGNSILNFNQYIAQSPIAYLDIELHGKLVEHRYSSKYANHYRFSDDFYRLDIDPSAIDENINLEDQVLQDIVRISNDKGIRIFIIDNITALISDFEKSKNAVQLMKKLFLLKKEKGCSFLVLAHTPKKDPTKEITADHLAGSKALMNLCDSSFAIGDSITDEK